MSCRVPALKGALVVLFACLCLAQPAHADWEFIRGDVNDDGSYNIADPVSILGVLFQMQPNNCENAMDSNDDDSVNIADAVHSLTALFAMGPQPPAPHPTCGQDATPGTLTCVGPLNTCNEIVATCTDNTGCATGEYCMKAAGDCAGTGTCATIPTLCPGIFQPVCGCDGNTYNNDCEAAMAGVNVDFSGTCVVSCTDNTACAANEFCEKAVGDCAGTGTCAPIPATCPLIINPVCGCDGNTYDNDCLANQAGVNVDTTGACVATCFNNGQCAAGEFCDKTDACFGPGICTVLPATCPLVFDPICGCDGQTYDNVCLANQAGINYDLVNTVPGQGCAGCSSSAQCAPGEFCDKSGGTPAPGCGTIAGTSAANNNCNGFGDCQPISPICCFILFQVCGCDGNSYSNACVANAAGVNAAYPAPGGVCP
ncbi:MAG: Kazal-type serine protease inhibitor domain-containing protein [Planctomycetota bacterium]